MKANEAPEKIYVDNPNHDFWYRTKDENCIEYARTDAFIEKACEWLESVLTNYAGYYVGKEILSNFKNYMEQ